MENADWTTLVHDTCRRIHIVHGGSDDETSVVAALGHMQGMWSCGAVYLREPQHFRDVLSRHAEITRANRRLLVCVSANLVSQLPDVYNDVCALRSVTVVLRVRAGGVTGSPYSKTSFISVLVLPSVLLEDASVVAGVQRVYRCPARTDLQVRTHGGGWAWTVGVSTSASSVHYKHGIVRNVSQDIADALFWWNAALFRGATFLHPAAEDKRFMLRFLAINDTDVLKEAEEQVFSWSSAASQIEVDGSIVVEIPLPLTTQAEWASYCTSWPQKDVFVVHADGSIQACTLRTNGALATMSETRGIVVKLYIFPGHSVLEARKEVAVESVKWKVFVPALKP
jgi:hypothetical protein